MKTKEIKERIEQLSSKQKALLAHHIQARHLHGEASNGHTTERLVAYVIDDGHPDSADFRNYLKELLPEYMVPQAFVQLEAFPRLPNGKINTRALPDPSEYPPAADTTFIAPRTTTEQQLAAIWREVLNFEPVGIHDNFFEIGGDSILSIQIIAKASKAGITLKPNALFEHQTIAELALSAETSAGKPVSSEIITGEVPLLPIQHWFFEEHQQAPHYWNQGLIFKNTKDLIPALLEEAIQHLRQQHDSLRLTFTKDAGRWKAHITAPDRQKAFQKFDLSTLPIAEQEIQIKEKTKTIQEERHLSEGPLFQGIYFDCGSRQPGQLLLIAHHLLVDAISWAILVEDLKTIYTHLREETNIKMPSKTTSYKDWGLHLRRLANDSEVMATYDFWERQIRGASSLPLDFETELPVTEACGASINFVLDINTTQRLRSKALTTYNTRMDEFLLAVLTRVTCEWTGANGVCFGLERHGRETLNTGMDLSNTIGWFTSYFPVTLTYNRNENAGTTLKSVKEQLRQIPSGGMDYGILRYLYQGNKKLNPNYHPPVIFNYLGNLAPLTAGVMGTAEELSENTRHPQSEQYHLLEINAFIREGQLNLRWGYHKQLHLPDTINSLIQDFEKTLLAFIDHCSDPEAGGFTPSDFPEAGLNQDDLDNLLGEIDS